jgi:inner membrane protein
MTARTHDLGAITALGIITLIAPPQVITLSTALVAILANQIGGIAPDIDQPTAPFWRNLPTGSFIGRIVDKALGGHRFLSHSILGLALFGFLSYLLLHVLQPIMANVDIQLVWYAFLIGMVSHLVLDAFTKEGVPWFLPIPVKLGLPPLKKFRITTGKHVETLFVFPLLLAFDVWLCTSHYGQISLFIHEHLLR